MKQIKEVITKEFTYDNKNEQQKHIEEMEKEGWSCSHQVSKNFGSLHDRDESHRKLFTSFQKIPVGYEYDVKENDFRVYNLNEKNEYIVSESLGGNV